MSAPIVTRQGDDLIFSWPDDGIQVRVDNVRESHDALRAELTVESTREGARGVLAWEELNLKVGRSRAELANRLKEMDPEIAWRLRLDALAIKAAESHRQGIASVDLADVIFTPDLPYLIPLLLPQGETSVLYGDGSSGKSRLALFLALSIATGQAIPGLEPPSRTGRVLVLDYETRDQTWARRIWRAAAGLGLGALPGGLITYKAMVRPLIAQLAELRREVAAGDYTLVVLDSIVPACDGNPSDAQVAGAVMNGMRSLERTALVVGHITKEAALNGGKKVPATIFGSQFFRNLARNTWELLPDEESPPGEQRGALRHTKANEEQRFRGLLKLTYRFGSDGGPITLEVRGSPDGERATEGRLRGRILAALEDGRETASQIAGHVHGRETSREEVETIAAKLRQMAGREVERGESDGRRGPHDEQPWRLRPNVRPTQTERSAANSNGKPSGEDVSTYRTPVNSGGPLRGPVDEKLVVVQDERSPWLVNEEQGDEGDVAF